MISLFYIDKEFFDSFKSYFLEVITKLKGLDDVLFDLLPNEYEIKGIFFYKHDLNSVLENEKILTEMLVNESKKNVIMKKFYFKLPLDISRVKETFYIKCINDYQMNTVNTIRSDIFENGFYSDNIPIITQIIVPNKPNQDCEVVFFGTKYNVERFENILKVPTKLVLSLKNIENIQLIKRMAENITKIDLEFDKETILLKGNKCSVIFFSRFFTEHATERF